MSLINLFLYPEVGGILPGHSVPRLQLRQFSLAPPVSVLATRNKHSGSAPADDLVLYINIPTLNCGETVLFQFVTFHCATRSAKNRRRQQKAFKAVSPLSHISKCQNKGQTLHRSSSVDGKGTHVKNCKCRGQKKKKLKKLACYSGNYFTKKR